MLRKSLIALAAVGALATAFVTDASAAPGHRGPGAGRSGFNAGIHNNFRGAFHGRGFRGNGFARFRAAPFVFGNTYAYDDGCWQLRRVPTHWGWQWRRVWVCY